MSKRSDKPDVTGTITHAEDVINRIELWNTLSKKREVFNSIKPGHISMYSCGPTVYNFIHIGNLRAFIAADIIRRVFEFNDFTVTHIMNVTDIGHLQSDEDDGEDKMTLALKREGKPLNLETMREVANRYYDAFREDLEKVNVLPAQLYPFASDHVSEDISFIQTLIDKGNAYAADDGIYFDTQSLPDYGRLGGISSDDASENESRIGDEAIKKSKKKNLRDFAVWKFNNEFGYDAAFGKGFPGWHIECSAMSMKYLGDTFDVHTGGIDHIPVHHNNEIAQSEALTGKLLANYWLHNAHIIMEGGKKMAKSGEMFITLESVIQKGISPLGFRYWLLGASYRTPMQFSFDAILQSEQAYQNLVARLAQVYIEKKNATESREDTDQAQVHRVHWFEKLKTTVNNDFDTANTLALFQTLLKNTEIGPSLKLEITEYIDQVFGLDLINAATKKAIQIERSMNDEDIPEHVRGYADARLQARNEKNWQEADRLRDQIAEAGYEIKDEANAYKLIKTLL